MIYWVLVTGAWLVWHIGFRIQVIGKENLIREGAFVLVPNHICAIDPVFVVIARFWGKKMQIMAKEELFANPILAFLFRQVGCVAVARGKGDTDMLAEVIEESKRGRGLLIFAEGTRSKTGWPGRVKSGAFVVADQAKAPIIPCRIIYCTEDNKMHLFCRVKVCFGEPIPAEALSLGEKRSGTKLRQNKKLLTDAWEKLYQDNKLDWMPDQPQPAPKEEHKPILADGQKEVTDGNSGC